jgi:arylsulfatase A-like enzyme
MSFLSRCLPFLFSLTLAAAAAERPNLIWIMADDLGYGELGCYGQQLIQTPQLDQMAKEGLRFTQFYAGATVCAPSRCVLMTGLHHGHTRVRGNAGKENPKSQALQQGDTTVAALLQKSGYQTALIGKWGLGDTGAAETGLPEKQGFQYFYGFLNQQHAHNHYPDKLWRNNREEPLANDLVAIGEHGAGYATKPTVYADDLFAEDAVDWIREHHKKAPATPFFLYWTPVVPHANNERTKALKDGTEVPPDSLAAYANKAWPAVDKAHAAMVSRLDRYVGDLLAFLKSSGLAEKTLVIFASDNGPHDESQHNTDLFKPSGPFSGIKRSLTDGGIRVPCIAWWPGTVPAGVVSGHVGHFQDYLGTAAELAGIQPPQPCDSISLVPVLLGKEAEQSKHEFLYWEFHEGGFKQAALFAGRWKGIRTGSATAPLAVHDLQTDPAEKTDVAAAQPEIAAKLDTYLKTARTPLPAWEPVWQPVKGKKAAH